MMDNPIRKHHNPDFVPVIHEESNTDLPEANIRKENEGSIQKG